MRKRENSTDPENTSQMGGPPEDSGIGIIDHPQLKSVLRNMGEWSFTTFMWVLWGYLFLPLVNILLWIFGGHLFYFTVFEEAHYRDAVDMFQKTGWFVLAVFLALRGWGVYNYHRFGKRDRRRSMPPASIGQLADFFNLPEATVARMQNQKEVEWDGYYDRF